MRKALCAGLLLAACTCIGLALLGTQPGAQDVAKPDTSTTTGKSEADLTGVINDEISKVWKRDKIRPADRCTDEEFLRRVYLDTVGMPPTVEEAVEFLDSTDKNKRDKLIDALIDDPRFGRHMADQWAVLLAARNAQGLSGQHLFANWMAEEINNGTGMQTIFREIVLAEGELVDQPQIVPWFTDGAGVPFTDMIGKLSKNLTGVQIQCAECHDHPYDENLTQKSFQGMAAFLTATQPLIDNNLRPQRIYIRTNADGPNKILKAAEMYDKLKPEQKAQVDQYIDYVKPVTLDGDVISTRDPTVWRSKLAAWLTSDDNVQTRRYVANRMWAIAFGSGLVNPVDDFTPLNEPSHPELLDALANDLLENGWDVRRLYRAILKSEAWQLSGAAPRKAERWHFAGYPVRPLTPEQFLSTLLGLLDKPQLDKLIDDSLIKPLDKAVEDLKAAEEAQKQSKDKKMQYYRYDIPTMNRYRDQFGAIDGRWYISRWAAGRYASLSMDDEMNSGENFTMSINQALAVMNGQFTNALSGSGKDSLLERIGNSFKTYDERVDALYLTVLSRRPTKAESTKLKKYFEDAEVPTTAAEDLLYALLMTTEFATNH
ncbi:MAG: DUF1553 domain-containing protein [Planctomycetes bacterium]|nr:DUF1553 domain-containing protein [Planctomycetota bacterium]